MRFGMRAISMGEADLLSPVLHPWRRGHGAILVSFWRTYKLHAGQVVDLTTNVPAVQIYQSTSFVLESVEHVQKICAPQYMSSSRNPSVDHGFKSPVLLEISTPVSPTLLLMYSRRGWPRSKEGWLPLRLLLVSLRR
ncbi:hypothetical protein K438DRAFT_235326 [Mycena galopus ATCC 62051]|nr:hypothetical protein K438DRAFT_235326 [Mycena galopus ATCC 62051]